MEKIRKICLRLFGDEAGGGSVPTAEVAEGAPQTETGETQAQEEAAPERNLENEFQNLIKGEYKAQYQQSVDKIINHRFKDAKTKEEQYNAIHEKILAPIMDRYGMKELDVDKLNLALMQDDDLLRAEADERNISIEELRNQRDMRLQLQTYQRQLREAQQLQENARMEAAKRQEVAAWMQQGDSVKASFPDFDLREFLGDADNIRMLRAGIPMEQVYKVKNYDKLVQKTAQKAETDTVNRIRARGDRPAENSTSTGQGNPVRRDVNSIPKEEFDAMWEAAKRGEKITFT